MYRDLYRDEVVTISAVQIIAVIAIISFTYILPVSMIAQAQAAPTSVYTAEALDNRSGDGRVAGVSTIATDVAASWDNFLTKAPNDSKLLLAGGLFTTGAGFGLLALISISSKSNSSRTWELETRF